jgi:nitrate/nitrite-specific signal transduction histidine kinase
VVSSGQPGHWGLTGMRERARAIRAELKIWSREAAGQGLFRLEQQAEW